MKPMEENYHDNLITSAIENYLQGDREILISILPLLKTRYELSLQADPKHIDNRSGKETYGYKNIQNDMDYISDRWNCSFRLKWLIDGIEGEHFKV